MMEVTAQATGHEEIMLFFLDYSFAANLIEVIFHSYLPSVHNGSEVVLKESRKRKENSWLCRLYHIPKIP